MSASPNPVPYGGSSTVSLTAQNTGAEPVYFALNIWRDTADWEYATLNPGQSFTNTRTISNIISNQMIWGYFWRWDIVAQDWILDDEADILIQLEGAGAVTVEKCITLRDDTWSCDPYTSGSCSCGDEGPQQNTFDWQQNMMCYSKITGDIEGARHMMVFFFDWGDGLYPVQWYEWDPISWTGYACFWAWPTIGGQFGNGIGIIGIYVDGVLIGQSNQFTVTGAPQGAIIDWWRKDPRIGPFTLGQQDAYVISGELKNTGPSGFYYHKIVQNPGTPQENLLDINGNDLAAGQGMGFGHSLNMPTVAGIYTLGSKIWGDGQSEPSWGSANTQIWDIYVGVDPPCEEYWSQLECEQNDCYWYDDSCHESALVCENVPTQTECEGYDCFWYNGACHSTIVCGVINNQAECEAHDCYWYDGSCHSSPPLPTAIIDTPHEGDTVTSPVHFEGHGEPVQNFNYLWWKIDGVAIWVHQDMPSSSFDYDLSPGHHDIEFWVVDRDMVVSEHVFIGIEVTALPEICSWIDAQGGPTALSIVDIFVVIDSYLYETPPSGYTFIPTLQNVFGVIDYYLGFDGDAATGCAYYMYIPATKENRRCDVNQDGVVNFQDAGLIHLHTIEAMGEDYVYDPFYDMNCDGVVNQADCDLCWALRD